jgi:valyl-tRNA synthetase
MKGDNPDAEKDRTATVLLNVLAESLRLLHPLIPFVSEEIYGKLPTGRSKGDGLLINAPYPEYNEERNDTEGERRFAFLQDLVRQIRTCRSECTVTPDKKLKAVVKAGEISAFLEENSNLVKLLAGLEELRLETRDGTETKSFTPIQAADGAIGLAGTGWEALLYLGGAVDTKALRAKFEKNLERDKQFIAALEKKIANPDFVRNAPPELVEGEKQKLAEATERTGKIQSYLRGLL